MTFYFSESLGVRGDGELEQYTNGALWLRFVRARRLSFLSFLAFHAIQKEVNRTLAVEAFRRLG
jgi:hypothetical protein